MRIHELEYEIDNPLNMQARTVDYNGKWENYIREQYMRYEKHEGIEWLASPKTIVYDFRLDCLKNNIIYRHHAYIMEDWMECK